MESFLNELKCNTFNCVCTSIMIVQGLFKVVFLTRNFFLGMSGRQILLI